MNGEARAAVPGDKPRKRKWLRRVGWALLALVAGTAGAWTWAYYTALWDRDALIARLRALGEPVWWNEVAAQLLAEPVDGTGVRDYHIAVNSIRGETSSVGPRVPS